MHSKDTLYQPIISISLVDILPLKIKTTLAIKTHCFSTKMHFSMHMDLINEACSLIRPLLTGTNGGLNSWTSLYMKLYIEIFEVLILHEENVFYMVVTFRGHL